MKMLVNVIFQAVTCRDVLVTTVSTEEEGEGEE